MYLYDGLAVPEHLANPPQAHPWLAHYFHAFQDLHTSRQIGMSAGPIPWVAIREYAMLNDYDEDETEELHRFVTAMDEVYLQWSANKARAGAS
jgi:hypothetical protein